MSRSIREKLAVLLGAATLSTTALADVELSRGAPPEQVRSELTTSAEAVERRTSSLRNVIEQRIEAADHRSRYHELDDLATLWMTLERREQLDRVVERGEQFVSVALRNQRRSEMRSLARRNHVELGSLELGTSVSDPTELIDAERFVLALEEPHRSAVLWSLTGMNHREVADELGASHVAVRKWAERLRRRVDRERWSLG